MAHGVLYGLHWLMHYARASFSEFTHVNFFPNVQFFPFEMHFGAAGELIVVGVFVFL
jgi:hypothetical protein